MPKKKTQKGTVPFLQRHHFYWLFIAAMGYIFFPPMAILARFGPGKDFAINILLTICGWFPGVAHNFFCQNIRDNSQRGRSPKWAVKNGFVRDPNVKRSRQRQWAHRYNERAPINPYDDPSYQDADADAMSNGYPRAGAGFPESSRTPENRHLRHQQSNSSRTTDEEHFYDPSRSGYGPAPGENEATGRPGKKSKSRSKSRSAKDGGASDFLDGRSADYYAHTYGNKNPSHNEGGALNHQF